MVLIIDNFDSFTYNVYHYFLILGYETIVKGRNEISIDDIEELKPDYIVISPGPGRPEAAELPLRVIERFKGRMPILGICLGHQCIGHYFGASVTRALEPVHGKVHEIEHTNKGIFSNIKNPCKVTRYHSLIVSRENFPDELEITSLTKDGEIMGIKHREYPIEGVQFHPEAVLTECGFDLLRNFLLSNRPKK